MSNNFFKHPILELVKSQSIGFSVHGDQIKVLYSPGEFYSSLIDGCRKAKQRITLAALYIGTGILEHKLVEVLDKRMSECGKDLSVSILLDHVRAGRDKSARTMLLPLIQKHPNCQVSLYHTPKLRGVWLHLLPAKADEAMGIQHIKFYVFDNDVIISGANLTKEYFTDRQDRYMVISECPALANFCHGLIERLSSVSLRMMGDNSLVAKAPHLHPYLGPEGLYEKHARDIVWGYYQQSLNDPDSHKTLQAGNDTWVFPLLQLPPLQVFQDSSVTQALLESMPPQSSVYLASPYFNLTEDYINTLLRKCKAIFNFLIPHPTASDFFGAPGFAGQIPWLYDALASSFLRRVVDKGLGEILSVNEFQRPGSSFHAKGVWITAPEEDKPDTTLIGSSNFNYRSVERDLECQLVIVTNNEHLRESLDEERRRLFKHGAPFVQERKPGLWHYIFLWLLKGFF